MAEAGLATAQANLESAEQELRRVRAEREALVRQRENLRLIAPVDALVVARDAEPGSTVVAGQSVVEVVDPTSLWVDTRFDQLGAGDLRAGLPARITLRSRSLHTLAGEVLRVEPRADAVTEELLAKVAFIIYTLTLAKVREIAVLKLIGTRNRTIAGMVLQQAVGLGLIGFVVGKIAATLWAPIFPKYVLLLPGDAVRGLGVVVLICVLASLIAIRAALRVDLAEAIGG